VSQSRTPLGRVAAPPEHESTSGTFYFWVDKTCGVERTQIVTTASTVGTRAVKFVGIVQEVYRRSRPCSGKHAPQGLTRRLNREILISLFHRFGSPPMLPFLKWPGGKRWFVTRHAALVPTTFGRYIEPFLGSGAVYFHLNPKRALLGDTNRELIDTYKVVKRDPDGVLYHLRRHQRDHCRDHYYHIRGAVMRTAATRAARFIYLIRTCFNGIYRVNLDGVFNVPIGTKTAVLLETDDFPKVARRLKGAILRGWDFERLIDKATRGDLVFADPPYTVRHNNNGFVKYNEKLFTWDDQIRLATALTRAAERGAHVVATNADHRDVQNLYPETTFTHDSLKRYSAISSGLTLLA